MDKLKFLRERLVEIEQQCQQVAQDEGYVSIVRNQAGLAVSSINAAINALTVPAEGEPPY